MDPNRYTKSDAGQVHGGGASDKRAAYTTGQAAGSQANSYPPANATRWNGNGSGTNDQSLLRTSGCTDSASANGHKTAGSSGGPYAMARWLHETAYEEPWNETHLRSTMTGSSCMYGYGYGCDGGTYSYRDGAGAAGSG